MTRRLTTASAFGFTAAIALLGSVAATAVSAAPVAPASTSAPGATFDASPAGLVQNVQFGKRGIRSGRVFAGQRAWRAGRGFRGNRWAGRRRGPGWVAPAIIGSAIIGGAIAASRSNYGSRWQQCADTYRSFDWDDGTYQPYGGGPRELCPYLRN